MGLQFPLQRVAMKEQLTRTIFGTSPQWLGKAGD
jgi:hypothetical protein